MKAIILRAAVAMSRRAGFRIGHLRAERIDGNFRRVIRDGELVWSGLADTNADAKGFALLELLNDYENES